MNFLQPVNKQKVEGTSYAPQEWESVVCPFCGSAAYKPYERYGDRWQYTHVRCKPCGLIYQSPRPKYDSAFVDDAYEFYADEIIKNISDVQSFLRQKSLTEQYDELLKEILLFDRQRTAILDIGCCVGTFLYQAMNLYPMGQGVEVSSRMARFVEENMNIKVHLEKYEDIQFDSKFSCINMSHVIEHVPNPKEWLEQSKRILAKDGILVISVPNMRSLPRRFRLCLKRLRLHRGKWEPWRTPDHLFEPTIGSMLRFLNQNGFEVLHYKTYSRKKMVDNSAFGKWYNQKKCWGSNLRFYVRVK
jgi:2-polyprenyl-3-methyl-5-hydroxy-6-metoxy-1,4-benzoquinol methylase